MRILLATARQPFEQDLARSLRAIGHAVVRTASRGTELLPAIERAGRLHAALLGQTTLGNEWTRVLRHLRGRFPGLPIVVLLSPGAEDTWGRALRSGAFDALPPSIPVETALETVCLALSWCRRAPSREPSTLGGARGARSVPPVGAEDLGAPCGAPASRGA